MGMKVGGKKGGPMGDINVTPLVDVVLVLLIIFMVVTPMLSSGVDVPLPRAKTTESTQDVGQHLVVSIKSAEQVFVDTTPVPLDGLQDAINASFRETGAKSILIKGDKALTWKDVHAVMDVIHADGEGMSTMLLAAEKLKEPE